MNQESKNVQSIWLNLTSVNSPNYLSIKYLIIVLCMKKFNICEDFCSNMENAYKLILRSNLQNYMYTMIYIYIYSKICIVKK